MQEQQHATGQVEAPIAEVECAHVAQHKLGPAVSGEGALASVGDHRLARIHSDHPAPRHHESLKVEGVGPRTTTGVKHGLTRPQAEPSEACSSLIAEHLRLTIQKGDVWIVSAEPKTIRTVAQLDIPFVTVDCAGTSLARTSGNLHPAQTSRQRVNDQARCAGCRSSGLGHETELVCLRAEVPIWARPRPRQARRSVPGFCRGAAVAEHRAVAMPAVRSAYRSHALW